MAKNGAKRNSPPNAQNLPPKTRSFPFYRAAIGRIFISRSRKRITRSAASSRFGLARISGNAALYGAPSGFRVTVKALKASVGAGFIVALTGDIMTMPGLPKIPAAEKIDIDSFGKISGLF